MGDTEIEPQAQPLTKRGLEERRQEWERLNRIQGNRSAAGPLCRRCNLSTRIALATSPEERWRVLCDGCGVVGPEASTAMGASVAFGEQEADLEPTHQAEYDRHHVQPEPEHDPDGDYPTPAHRELWRAIHDYANAGGADPNGERVARIDQIFTDAIAPGDYDPSVDLGELPRAVQAYVEVALAGDPLACVEAAAKLTAVLTEVDDERKAREAKLVRKTAELTVAITKLNAVPRGMRWWLVARGKW